MNSQATKIEINNTEETELDDYYVSDQPKNSIPEASLHSKTGLDENQAPKFIEFLIAGHSRSQVVETQVGWWFGRIERVFDKYFTAVLEDKKGNKSLAEFDKEEVTPGEQNLLTPNAKFSYSITRADKTSGREYVSKISISGPEIWTKNNAESAKQLFKEYFPEKTFDF
jgi:hypothetical protein